MNKLILLCFFSIGWMANLQAINHIDSLRQAEQRATGDEKIRLLNQLSESVVYTNPLEALEFGEQAFLLAEKLNQEGEKFKALKNIGYANGYLGNYTKSMQNMEDGLSYYKSIGDSVKIAEALSDIGYLHIAMGNFTEGALLYRQALAIREKINDSKGIGYSLNNLGALYWEWKKPDDALQYYLQALPYLERDKQNDDYATILGNIGVIYKEKNEYEQALNYYTQSLKINQQRNHNIGIAKIQSNMAMVYAETGDYQKALELFDQSSAIRQEIGDKEGLALVWHNTASLYKKMKQINKAIDFFQRSEKLSRSIGSKNMLLKNYQGLSSIYQEQENFEQAFYYLQRSKSLSDSLFNAESHRQIEEIKTSYETEKKALQIENLQKKNENQQLLLDRRRNYFYVVITISFFILVFIHYSYLRRKAILKQKTALIEQKLLRVQMNPHFIFNSISAIQSYIFSNSKKDAVNYLSSFASLMRLILENSATETILFEKEKQTLEFYLQLQSLRYPDKFSYQIIVDPAIDPENTLIPPMLGQPFIENAIEHGLKNISEPGQITIRYYLKGNQLFFEVEDNGIGISNHKSNSSNHKSMALSISRDRLELINRKQSHQVSFEISDLSTTNPSMRGTLVRFCIPLKKMF